MWANCEILGDVEVRIEKEEGGTVVPCAKCGLRVEESVYVAVFHLSTTTCAKSEFPERSLTP